MAGTRPVDYEAEYNNRARVPEHPAIVEGWVREAAAYRAAAKAELGVAYGDTERTRLDIFHPAGGGDDGPAILFIHGGYWRSMERDMFSHLAAGANARGVTVAMPGYDLCPAVPVRRIVEELRAAARFLHRRTGRPIVVSGHSAGGHLAAALAATDWPAFDAELPADMVAAGLGISGLYDLAPLRATSINDDLRLDEDEARAMSPLHWPVRAGLPFEAWVGGAESDEYLRQSRTLAAEWSGRGAAARWRTVDGANHFTVIASLGDPSSEMVEALVGLARRS